MKCKKCGSNKVSIERRPDGDCKCLDCGFVWKNYQPKKPTNGDRIRAMSDEELASILKACGCQFCNGISFDENGKGMCVLSKYYNKKCDIGILAYLKSEVE